MTKIKKNTQFRSKVGIGIFHSNFHRLLCLLCAVRMSTAKAED